ncbi:MAG: flagellar biosynthesis protein FlhF [Bacteroidota bacterium]|nr:flagellar biosynthesis protein FlhF [Bacteroidota bacterium]
MQIKKYLATTLKEATVQMKAELGDDAIIISTRIKEGNPRLGTTKMFELVAGVEDDYDKLNARKESPAPVKETTYNSEVNKIAKKVYQKNNSVTLGEMLEEASKNKLKPKQTTIPSIEKELKEVVDNLVQREVSKQIINQILEQLKKYKNVLHSSNIESYLLSCISSMLNTSNFELKKRNKPSVISVVGPTGVGKTTCIAKIAVISKILHNLNVGLISIDTYRLGALDQLKIFSEISNIDMQVAYEASEMPQLLNNFRKKDIIFIDTAGRSQRNANQLDKNKEFFKNISIDQSFLVLSATSSLRTLYDVIDKFRVFNFDSAIFTKIDEAPAFGNLLNVSVNKKLPISFLANGQVIPDDIISADSDFIANMIYSGKTSK